VELSREFKKTSTEVSELLSMLSSYKLPFRIYQLLNSRDMINNRCPMLF
jgi:hypothetical protein